MKLGESCESCSGLFDCNFQNPNRIKGSGSKVAKVAVFPICSWVRRESFALKKAATLQLSQLWAKSPIKPGGKKLQWTSTTATLTRLGTPFSRGHGSPAKMSRTVPPPQPHRGGFLMRLLEWFLILLFLACGAAR